MTDQIRAKSTFETLKFDNLALKTLPIDSITDNYVREVRDACFSKIQPTPIKNPKLLIYSKNAMELLDLDESELQRNDAAEYLSGNKLMNGSETAAHCYCGHQFGVFAGQLGDGAAIYLGEVINKKGERIEIQLKGAGLTPYSRTADGRKVLRSSLREFLCSEAMHNLHIATTRAGSCITSETKVVRDILYDGNPRLETCAVVLRLAESFIRFGSFEIFRPMDRLTGGRGPSFGRNDIQITLFDYVCDTFYKDIASGSVGEAKYEKVFEEIVRRTAKLVADWQSCGFVHGVLNTDNMSILGLTIDYGPYGFLDRYDPNFIFNGSDNERGRYTYKNQPDICEWNLKKVAEALNPALSLAKSLPIIERLYKSYFKTYYLEKMRKKLGLFTKKETDEELIQDLFDTMYKTGSDFTNSFRLLSSLNSSDKNNMENEILDYLKLIIPQCCPFEEYKQSLKPKFPKDTLKKLEEILNLDPDVLLRFGLSPEVVKHQLILTQKIDEIKDWTVEDKLKKDSELWTNWLKKYLNRLYEEENSIDNNKNKRIDLMNSTNPRFILRNHLAQDSIEHAEQGDFERAKIFLKILENPFSNDSIENVLIDFKSSESLESVIKVDPRFFEKPPAIEKCTKLTCSS